ncbi:MAG: branched-chain amino acid ABC transporter permease [Bacillota bacterium]|nr:branched-chain amino acid ABC transporter permease [Bacillota bacterium]
MLKNLLKKENSVLWIIAFASLILPFAIDNRYYQDIIILTFLWAGLSSSWNLYSGYCGRLSIGHAAFMGMGAYSASLLSINFGITPWVGMVVGCIISGTAALIIGGTTLRLKGTFFVLSTIAFAEIMKTVAITAKNVTNGSLGVQVPYDPGFANLVFAGKIPYALIIWGYMILVIFICTRLEKSKLGYGLIAVGENQQAAENLGVNSTKTMLIAYVLSAMLTSIGGALFVQYVRFIEPSTIMSLAYSVNFILYAIAGGMGTAFGPMLGAFILVPATNLLRGAITGVSGLHQMILGLILIGILLYRPDGILLSIRGAMNKRRARAMKKEEEGGGDDAADGR